MKKWLKLLVITTFACCAMNVLADGQIVSAVNTSSASQPVLVPQGNSTQAPSPGVTAPIDFGDNQSTTLDTKAWGALADNDLSAVLAYTNKCISLYADQARMMQAGLTAYVSGSNDDISQEWALNDVATAYYIQGEAYRAANMKDKAKEAYKKILSDYSYGQCYDPSGFFWRPAVAAREKLEMLAGGVDWDFGDYTSTTLTTKAWFALEDKDLKGVLAFTNKCISLYGDQAKRMQSGLNDYVSGPNDEIFKKWALNDVAIAYFIQAAAYRHAKMKDKAQEAYNTLISKYSFAQAYDSGISQFSAGEFTGSMTPEGLIKALQASGINVPGEETSIKSLNKLLEDKTLYRVMKKRNKESDVLIIDRLEKGHQLTKKEIKLVNRSLIETNYPSDCPIRRGWFWKPAPAAKQILHMMELGGDWETAGDYSSADLTLQAWLALADGDLKDVEDVVNRCVALFGGEAKKMQASLKDYTSGSNDQIGTYWALNDVGTCLFILGEAYQNAGKNDDAIKAYKRVVNEFGYAQCFDQGGWFWKVAPAAQEKLDELGSN